MGPRRSPNPVQADCRTVQRHKGLQCDGHINHRVAPSPATPHAVRIARNGVQPLTPPQASKQSRKPPPPPPHGPHPHSPHPTPFRLLKSHLSTPPSSAGWRPRTCQRGRVYSSRPQRHPRCRTPGDTRLGRWCYYRQGSSNPPRTVRCTGSCWHQPARSDPGHRARCTH